MGIYLPNMEMPTGDEMLCINIFPDGKVTSHFDLRCMPVAKAVPVPPHGRLGDLAELYASLKKWLIQNRHSMTEATRVWIRGILEGIAAAPTIIPAEDGEA